MRGQTTPAPTSAELLSNLTAGFDARMQVATFEDDLSFSEGVEHVLVNGAFVVRDRETVEGARPGRSVLGKMYAGG